MKKFTMIFCLIFVLTVLMGYTTVPEEQQKKETSDSKMSVGTFDSRAIAIAYYQTEEFANYMKGLISEHKKAKESGDKEHVEELEAKLGATQELIDKQAFSTWSVDNILEIIEGKIPNVAKQAEVDLIVSKWDITYQSTEVEFIDVTYAMAKLINTNEQTLKTIEQLMTQDPVPLEELEKDAR